MRPHSAIGIVFGVVLLFSQALGAEEADSRSAQVSLPFLAETTHGELIGEVGPADLQVVDNGMLITKVNRVERESNLPLRLMLLVDRSGSIGPDDEKELRLLTEFIANEFDSRRDVLEVWEFDEQLRLSGRWNGKASGPLTIPLAEIHSRHTAMNDAVVELCRSVGKDSSAGKYRNVLLLLSDGEDNNSRHELQEAIEAAQMAAVRVYPVYLRVSWHWEAKDALGVLAEATGGKLLDARNQKKLARAMRQVSEELRQQFRVTYTVPRLAGIQKHSVRLMAVSKGVKLRSAWKFRTE